MKLAYWSVCLAAAAFLVVLLWFVRRRIANRAASREPLNAASDHSRHGSHVVDANKRGFLRQFALGSATSIAAFLAVRGANAQWAEKLVVSGDANGPERDSRTTRATHQDHNDAHQDSWSEHTDEPHIDDHGDSTGTDHDDGVEYQHGDETHGDEEYYNGSYTVHSDAVNYHEDISMNQAHVDGTQPDVHTDAHGDAPHGDSDSPSHSDS